MIKAFFLLLQGMVLVSIVTTSSRSFNLSPRLMATLTRVVVKKNEPKKPPGFFEKPHLKKQQ